MGIFFPVFITTFWFAQKTETPEAVCRKPMPVVGSIVPCFSFSLWYTLKCCCRAGWRELWHVAELSVDVWQEMLGAHFILSHRVRKNFLRKEKKIKKEKKEANWLQFSNDYIIYYSYTSGALGGAGSFLVSFNLESMIHQFNMIFRIRAGGELRSSMSI